MKIILYDHQRAHSTPWLMAFGQGLTRHGIAWTHRHTYDGVVDCDLSVSWGQNASGRIIERQKRNGARHLMLERGYLGDRHLWVSAGYDGLNNRADFCNQDVPSDRARRHWRGWLQPRHVCPNGYAMLIGQVTGDAAIRDVDIASWYRETAEGLEARGYQVAFRPHPLEPNTKVRGIRTLPPTEPLAKQFAGAAVVVGFNSNATVLAACAGLPVVTMDPGAMAWPISAHALDEPFEVKDRQRWLERLAYCQWSAAEMEAGETWSHLQVGVTTPAA